MARRRERITYRCPTCYKSYEYQRGRQGRQHWCDARRLLAVAIVCRDIPRLYRALDDLERAMRRVTGIRHRRWRKDAPDPNLLALGADWRAREVRRIGRQWWRVMRTVWREA